MAGTSRRIAVVPAYNEEPTVVAVLDELYPLVDELVVVDDGSTDNTRREIERWMAGARIPRRAGAWELGCAAACSCTRSTGECRRRTSRR